MSEHDDDLHDPDIRALYRKLPAETPREASDDAIRAAARRAVAAGPQKSSWSATRKSALATAAMLVLGVGLVLQMQTQSPEKLREVVSSSPAAPAAEAPARMQAEATATADAAAASAEMKAGTAPESLASAGSAPAGASGAASRAEPLQDSLKAMPAKRALARTEVNAPAEVAAAPMAAPQAAAPAPAPVLAVAPAGENEMRADRMAEKNSKALAADEAQSSRKEALSAAPAAAAAKPASGTAREYSLAKEKKMEAAISAQAQIPPQAQGAISSDYRQAMAAANFLLARQQLEASTDAGTIPRRIDLDLLLQIDKPGSTPGCSAMTAVALGDSKALCDLLILHAAKKPLPVDWRETLNGKKLWLGEYAYRRSAIEALFAH